MTRPPKRLLADRLLAGWLLRNPLLADRLLVSHRLACCLLHGPLLADCRLARCLLTGSLPDTRILSDLLLGRVTGLLPGECFT